MNLTKSIKKCLPNDQMFKMRGGGAKAFLNDVKKIQN